MRSTLRLFPLLALIAALAFKIGGGWAPASTAHAASPPVNACGCFRDSTGTCYCGKKAGKCVCPGECEPKGCEEKRVKELDKEIEAEAKRARDAEKKQQDEQAEKKRKEEAPPPEEQSNDDSSAQPASPAAASDDDADDEKVDKKKLKKKGKAAKSSEKSVKKEPSAGASG